MTPQRFVPELSRLPSPLVAAATAAGAQAKQAYAATAVARRVALAREACPEEFEAGKPRLMRLLGEADVLLEPLRRAKRKPAAVATANPQVAMIIPGFGASPLRMRYLARQLESAGHVVKRWGQGRNWGPDPERFDAIEERLLREGAHPVMPPQISPPRTASSSASSARPMVQRFRVVWRMMALLSP